MINYVSEEKEGIYNIFFVDEEYSIKDLVAVVFNLAHSRIITKSLNDYIERELKEPKKVLT